MAVKSYLELARPSHWFKNLFVVPGTVIAMYLTKTPFSQFWWALLVGMTSICLIASANYVINEWLDARFDRYHPIKKNRPSVIGNLDKRIVYLEYCLLSLIALGLAGLISLHFLLCAFIFLSMGVLYNVEPFRSKDKPIIDVLSESINNPIRLTLGWFIVTNDSIPPSSLFFGYWMAGAFLMSIKRYAEYKALNDKHIAQLYRKSFAFYTEERLLVLSFFYGACSAFFMGVFLIKYQIEFFFALPFLAVLFSWYLHIGLKPNSIAQTPERLYQEKYFLLYIIFLIVLLSVLLAYDLPWLDWFLKNSFVDHPH
ncbi:UbiA prenyltransferase family protein [bacterium]|nr:UbiA prenyltransferase family protein [bacterium]